MLGYVVAEFTSLQNVVVGGVVVGVVVVVVVVVVTNLKNSYYMVWLPAFFKRDRSPLRTCHPTNVHVRVCTSYI